MNVPKKLSLLSIASIPLIMTLGNSMLIPVLPDIARELGVSSLQVSLLITVYAVVAIVLIPVAGFLSDRYGRKRIIIPSLIIAAAGGAVCAGAAWLMREGAYYPILAGRFLQGIGAAGASPIVLPLVGDMFKDEKQISRGLGVIESFNTFGKVLSPILGSALAIIVWFAPFAAIPALCLISIVLVGFLVKVPKRDEQEQKPRVKTFLESIAALLKSEGKWLSGIFATGCIAMFLVFGVLFYLSTVLEESHGIHGIAKGGVLAIPLGALCVASFITGKKIGESKKKMRLICTSGFMIATASLFAAAWFPNLYVMLGMLVLTGTGIGLALPSLDALITEGIDKKRRGSVTAIYSSMRFVGVSVGPPVISLLLSAGQRQVFFLLSGISLLGLGVILFFIRSKGKGASPQNEESSHSHREMFIGKRRSPA